MISSATAAAVQLTKQGHLYNRLRLFAGYSMVQIVAQGLAFVAGIIVVRSLSKADYACFIIVNTIGPVMNMLSDNGVTNSLASIGGRFWKDDREMGSLINTAFELRRRLVLFSCAMVTPLLVWMLLRNNASVFTCICLVLLTVAGVCFQLNVGVLNVVINLRQQIGRMQSLVFMSVIPRLALLGLFIALGILNAPLAAATGVVALAFQFWLLQRWVRSQIDQGAPTKSEYRQAIVAIVKRQAPLTIYFCLQSQIGIWLLSFFGSTHRVADFGALGRIGAIFTILVSTFSALVVPRFAREQDRVRMRSRYALILLGFTTFVGSGTVLVWLLPRPLLWMLGPQYAQLGDLAWLAVLAAGTSALAGVLYSLNVNKGWIPPAVIVIPAEIITQVVLFCCVDLTSVRGILTMSVIAPLIPSLINLVFGIQKLRPMPCFGQTVKL